MNKHKVSAGELFTRNLIKRVTRVLNIEKISWSTAKKSFSKIQPVDIVIFDGAGAEFLRQSLHIGSIFTLHTRGEEFHVNPKTLLLRMWFLLKTGRPRKAYFLALFKQLKPRVAITFIDNNRVFFELANTLKNTTFIAVQNGWRVPFPVPQQVTNLESRAIYLSFGENEINENIVHNFFCKESKAVGSLKASLVSSWPFGNSKRIFMPLSTTNAEWRAIFNLDEDYLSKRGATIISAIDSEFKILKDYSGYTKWGGHELWAINDVLLVLRMGRFLKNHPAYSVTLLCRPEVNSVAPKDNIISTFAEALSIQVFEPQTWWANYQLISTAECVVAAGSTLSIEALGLGKRVLIDQIFATKGHVPVIQPEWWLLNSTETQFNCQLENLLAQSDSEYQSRYQAEILYYSGQPTAKPTYELVRDEVVRAMTRKRHSQD